MQHATVVCTGRASQRGPCPDGRAAQVLQGPGSQTGGFCWVRALGVLAAEYFPVRRPMARGE